jgi:hypothetical protein
MLKLNCISGSDYDIFFWYIFIYEWGLIDNDYFDNGFLNKKIIKKNKKN